MQVLRGLLVLLSVGLVPCLASQLWNEEDLSDVLKASEDADHEMNHNQEKAIDSWLSTGEGSWSLTSGESSWSSEFTLNWASSYDDSNTAIGSGDLDQASSGEIKFYETFVSTYTYSFKHTWGSTGIVTRPDGKEYSWSSRYTTYWTSTFTSSFTTGEMVSRFTSAWTSCTTGDQVFTSTYLTTLWNSGSALTGEGEVVSSFLTTTWDSWLSSYVSAWTSTVAGGKSSSWYSVSSTTTQW